MRRFAPLLFLLILGVAFAQPRAWRDINFGDPLLIVADKLVQHEDIKDGGFSLKSRVERGWTTPEALIRWGRPQISIGGQDYTFRFSFYDGRLYEMALVSDSYDASFFDTYVRDAEWRLVQLITEAHGQATTTRNVSFLDLQNGFVTWTRKWATNVDGAAYAIGLARQDFRYYAVLSIEWTWLRELYEAALGVDDEADVMDAADDF